MKTGIVAAVAGLAVSSMASAVFTNYVVTSTNTSNSGQNLTVYTVWARFNGPTDTVLNAFNMAAVGGSSLTGFWHKDLDSLSSGVLTQSGGTWSPTLTGNATANRPFDSYLTIGGIAAGANTTNADPSWNSGGSGAGAGDSRGWNRPDLPNNGTIGWFNSSPPNLQGRVGSPNNTATDVRIGQFVLSQGDSAARTYTLTVGYNNGVAGSAVQFATGNFSLPAPGALALLGLAGLAGRRRR
ncbi:MAG: hypothetical protein RLY21_981 [Planctomycetota bacterium]|jgi:MYXO-CTERM domain-containing protein